MSGRAHCYEHFLFTVDCAGCQDTDRARTSSPGAIEHERKARSFGFTDNMPAPLLHPPSMLERVIVDPYSVEQELLRDIVKEFIEP